ncbi:hypothetical protein L1987_40087 [Smallanthus sonchifolius]|uniref:Uncharacterized protein n=1 Tax=Smallanthus sonchifolius TaxID=185202 RepID=A0ACB9GSN9_9ASTR|nr:hypothetical protein L1987_40087 [Smallanthus sonchifolius]
MTEEEEEEEEKRIDQEKKEIEIRRKEREDEEMVELKEAQERKTVILLREQQIQLYARQLDETRVHFNKEEEERESKRKEEAKFRITDSELAKEMREEWIEALISQGENADYLEKLSNKEIYRAFMGQQGQLAMKKKAEEEEKAK